MLANLHINLARLRFSARCKACSLTPYLSYGRHGVGPLVDNASVRHNTIGRKCDGTEPGW